MTVINFEEKNLTKDELSKVELAEKEVEKYMEVPFQDYLDFYNTSYKDIVHNFRWFMYSKNNDLKLKWKDYLKGVDSIRNKVKEKKIAESINILFNKCKQSQMDLKIVKSINMYDPISWKIDSYVVIAWEYYEKEKEKYCDSIIVYKSKYPDLYKSILSKWWKFSSNPMKY